MTLFFKEEHITCYNHKLPTSANFSIITLPKNHVPQTINVDRSVLIFMLSGKVLVTYNSFRDIPHEKGAFVLLPRNSCCYIKVVEDCTFISCAFVPNMDSCSWFSFQQLADFLPKSFVYHFITLPIRERIAEFLTLLEHCLDDNMNCPHFHELKERELFILLRTYYNKEELAAFFFPLLGKDMDFKDFVLNNYLRISDLNEFAAQLNMSLNTFKRRFQQEFGQSAHKWIMDRKTEWIYKDILLTDQPFSEIGLKYNFNSPTYFSEYCKKHLGKSPQELREIGFQIPR